MPTHDLTIPLRLRGVISSFQNRLLTSTDVESLPHVKMTRDVWDPRSDNFTAAEAHAKAVSSVRVTDHDDAEARFISAIHASEIPPDMTDADNGDKDNLYERLVKTVRVTYPSPDQENHPNATLDSKDTLDYQVNAVISSDRKPKLTPEELSQKWCIGLDTANRTLKCTTQTGL